VLLAALAVLVAGGVLAGRGALAAAAARWRAELRIVAVLREAVPRPEAPDGVVAAARSLAGAASVRYVAPADALAELRRLLGPRAEGLDRLPANPVPARLEVTPRPELDATGLRGLMQALGRLQGVDEVDAALGWVEPVERLQRGLWVGGLALAATLALAAVAAAAGATTAARRAGADECAILRLAGVGEARLAAPLVLQALTLATLGAGLGVALLLLGSEVAAAWTGAWLRAGLGVEPLPGLPGPWLAGLVGGGATLGLLGALAAGRA
jgi:cell division protein FtsX